MTDNPMMHLCPCESGIPYEQCCGTTDRTAVNADILGVISNGRMEEPNRVPPPLRAAIDNITTHPDLFPARINFFDDKAFLVKMSPRWYRESVFLDPARIKGTCVIQTDLAWLQAAADHIPWQPTGLIFHTAFCGSTLMAQALDALYESLPLREPEVLGNVMFYLKSKQSNQQAGGEQGKPQWLERVMRLLSRRVIPQQGTVIKANDYANPLMIDLLHWRNDLPILFMYTPLEEFLAGCLKAENRRAWIRGRYQSIPAGAADLLGGVEIAALDDNAYGEMAAVYWSYNVALYHRARLAAAPKLRSLDFNAMLANPLEAIQLSGALLGLQPLDGVSADTEINRLFGVYSKNSRFKYSPQQRRHDIQSILEKHPEERQQAERLARRLLQQDYPEKGLPGDLLTNSEG
jgi:hypothetical protein